MKSCRPPIVCIACRVDAQVLFDWRFFFLPPQLAKLFADLSSVPELSPLKTPTVSFVSLSTWPVFSCYSKSSVTVAAASENFCVFAYITGELWVFGVFFFF